MEERPNSKQQIYESRLYDKITLFFKEVFKDLSGYPRELEEIKKAILNRFTQFVGQILMEAPICIRWKDINGKIYCTLPTLGSSVSNQYYSIKNRKELKMQPNTGEDETLQLERFVTSAGIVKGIKIIFKGDNKAGNVLIILNEGKNSDYWNLFTTYFPGLKLITSSLNALLNIQIEKFKGIELTHSVSHLLNTPRPFSLKHLENAINLMEELNNIGAGLQILKQIEELCIWVLQELLSTGWTVQTLKAGYTQNFSGISKPLEGINEDEKLESSLQNIAIQVENAIKAISSSKVVVAEKKNDQIQELIKMGFRLSSLRNCLLAFLNNNIPLENYYIENEKKINDKDRVLSILPYWTRLHKLYRSEHTKILSKSDREMLETEWMEVVKRTQGILMQYLSNFSWQLAEDDSRSPVYIRNWLQLWFFLQVLQHDSQNEKSKVGTDKILEDERDYMRTELSFALRESLRFACFGERSDYLYQPATFLAALRVIVDYHAHWMMKLPRVFDIRRFLEEIGEEKYLSRSRTPEEHLQHVFNVYISGHFLLSLKTSELQKSQGEDGIMTVADTLASTTGMKPGEGTVSGLLKSFSLAALFHDMGHLLFPFAPHMKTRMSRGGYTLRFNLENIEKNLRSQGTDIVERCINDLEEKNYFDLKKEEPLNKWFSHQKNVGKPDHGLLSAWYLHHLSSPVKGDQVEIIKKAVRAILLHNAVTAPIDIDHDPVAGLLVLCDELFTWEQTGYIGSSPSAIGKSLHIKASVVSPHEPVYRWLIFENLKFQENSKGELSGTLSVPDPESSEGWPKITYILQNPERLDKPAFILWLIKAQSLGRVSPSTKNRWSPEITIKGRIAPFLQQQGLDSKQLLSLIARDSRLPLASFLSRWLSRGKPFEGVDNSNRDQFLEQIKLRPLPFELFHEDISDWVHELEQDAMSIIKQF